MSYSKLRTQVLERDQFKCTKCKINFKNLHVHHIIPKRKGGADCLENLITLCEKCHRVIEPIRSLDYGYKVTSGKMIKLKIDTYNELKELGRFGESMDTLLTRLMDTIEGKKDKKK